MIQRARLKGSIFEWKTHHHGRTAPKQMTTKKPYNEATAVVLKLPSRTMLIGIGSFLFGCLLSTMVVLNLGVLDHRSMTTPDVLPRQRALQPDLQLASCRQGQQEEQQQPVSPPLAGVRILVVLVAYDFGQLPHLEDVLDSYHDVCWSTGVAALDVIVHATVAYPVTLIDLLNSRFTCEHFTVTIALKPAKLRLFLVDEHRQVFYDHIDEYDLFIYSEDDIRVTPTTIVTYWRESMYIAQTIGNDAASDYNIGIVRYELNFPPNVIMDDKTRHATQNVTRVYWEHSGSARPVVGNAVLPLDNGSAVLRERYLTMHNHHQGMFLATRNLLKAWQKRSPQCDFAHARLRPGSASQPSEGTQRVWMSSQMLYGRRHCNVTQLLSKQSFGTLTVWHLPNKNYRRVGKYRNREFADGTEQFDQPAQQSLLTAMELHLAVRQAWPPPPQFPYRGITMIDQVGNTNPRDRTPLLERRLREYQAYVDRGGVLSAEDMVKTNLVEEA
jgi:hypothetical protein